MKRLKIYKSSNCTFDPTIIEACSYKWWKFVRVVEGKIVFSSYRYSVSTTRHQNKVRSLMQTLGIKVDYYLKLPRGVRYDQTLQELFTEAEETVCKQYLTEMLKRDERNERSRLKRQAAKQAKTLELSQFPKLSLVGA